jgi:RNA-binding protein 39
MFAAEPTLMTDVPPPPPVPVKVAKDLDEDSEGLKLDSRGRAALMARLAGQDVSGVMTGGIDPNTGFFVSAEAMAAAAAAPQMPLAAQPITQVGSEASSH